MSIQLLRDINIEPTDEIIASCLGNSNKTYLNLIKELNKNNIYGAIVGKAVYSGKLDLKEVLEVSKK